MVLIVFLVSWWLMVSVGFSEVIGFWNIIDSFCLCSVFQVCGGLLCMLWFSRLNCLVFVCVIFGFSFISVIVVSDLL